MPPETGQQRGSRTARGGFQNEDFVIATFNNWENNELAKERLRAMSYDIDNIESVRAVKIQGHYKADVQVQIRIEIIQRETVDVQNIQVKLVSNQSGFNQIDKRRIERYKELWNFPEDIEELLKYYTGENLPYIDNPRDSRRMFMNEFSREEQRKLLDYFTDNKILIASDILKGRGQFAAEWMLVILRIEGQQLRWVLKPINFVINHYSTGDVEITNLGNLKIGRITMQRKGGDAGRDSAKMLQFKINPCEIMD